MFNLTNYYIILYVFCQGMLTEIDVWLNVLLIKWNYEPLKHNKK